MLSPRTKHFGDYGYKSRIYWTFSASHGHIEKAAPEVFDLLLGVFDEGRLTDAYGRLTTFRSERTCGFRDSGTG